MKQLIILGAAILFRMQHRLADVPQCCSGLNVLNFHARVWCSTGCQCGSGGSGQEGASVLTLDSALYQAKVAESRAVLSRQNEDAA